MNPIKGRISRLPYFGSLFCLYCLFVISAVLLGEYFRSLKGISLIVGILLYVPFLFYYSVKRFHDIGLTGKYALLLLVPGLNGLVFLYLLFTRGTVGSNEYGFDPIPPKLPKFPK